MCTKFLKRYMNIRWYWFFSFVIHLMQSLPACGAVGHRNPPVSCKHLLPQLQAAGPHWKDRPPPRLSARPQKGNEMLSGIALWSPGIHRDLRRPVGVMEALWKNYFLLLMIKEKYLWVISHKIINTESWLSEKGRVCPDCERVSHSSKILST